MLNGTTHEAHEPTISRGGKPSKQAKVHAVIAKWMEKNEGSIPLEKLAKLSGVAYGTAAKHRATFEVAGHTPSVRKRVKAERAEELQAAVEGKEDTAPAASELRVLLLRRQQALLTELDAVRLLLNKKE